MFHNLIEENIFIVMHYWIRHYGTACSNFLNENISISDASQLTPFIPLQLETIDEFNFFNNISKNTKFLITGILIPINLYYRYI